MALASRGQLARQSLADAIRSRLREQILSGELSMGQRLTEQGVAEIFGPGSSLQGISAWLETALANKEN